MKCYMPLLNHIFSTQVKINLEINDVTLDLDWFATNAIRRNLPFGVLPRPDVVQLVWEDNGDWRGGLRETPAAGCQEETRGEVKRRPPQEEHALPSLRPSYPLSRDNCDAAKPTCQLNFSSNRELQSPQRSTPYLSQALRHVQLRNTVI